MICEIERRGCFSPNLNTWLSRVAVTLSPDGESASAHFLAAGLSSLTVNENESALEIAVGAFAYLGTLWFMHKERVLVLLQTAKNLWPGKTRLNCA